MRIGEGDAVSVSMTDEAAGPHLLSSTQKSLVLLEALAEAGRACGVSELAQLVGSTRGTVHKRLATLVAAGWVEQNADGRYGLSLLAARVGNAALAQAGLGDRIHEVLRWTVQETGETCSVAMLHRDAALIVQRAESDQVLHADIRIGTQIPLSAGASSLVLLAFALSAQQRDELRARGVELATEERVAAVEQAGVAYTIDEFVEGISAVAIPLRDDLRFTTMALTLAGPRSRFEPDHAERVLRVARERIAALTRGER
jgi:DNA-binding IclR family transcriptional regulator